MNSFVLAVFSLAAVAVASPIGEVALTQDTLGNYNLRYLTEDAQRSEKGHDGGKVEGSYTYLDKEGHRHTINYISSPDQGFIATGDVPHPVHETPEVAAARHAHLAVVERERSILPPLREETEFVQHVPVPVHFVHEVPVSSHHVVDDIHALEAARAEHFAAHKKALDHLAHEYQRLSF